MIGSPRASHTPALVIQAGGRVSAMVLSFQLEKMSAPVLQRPSLGQTAHKRYR